MTLAAALRGTVSSLRCADRHFAAGRLRAYKRALTGRPVAAVRSRTAPAARLVAAPPIAMTQQEVPR